MNFYTALYHTFLSPTVYMDADGKYKGLDQNVHQANGFTNYTTFSLWDTYRALHPFFNIVQPTRNREMIQFDARRITTRAFIKCCPSGRITPTKTGA